jgi:uncharacterized protein (TIGR00369 family)
MAGIDYLRSILREEIPPPPIALTLGFRLSEVTEGRAVFTIEPGEHHYNPIGLVHGGVLATLLDSAMGCAIHSRLPAGSGYATTDLNVHFVRPVTRETPRLRCESELMHLGGRIATASGRVLDDAGNLYAHATTSCLVIRQEKAR